MRGIMYKDFYEAFCLKKNMLMWILAGILVLLMVVFASSPYVFMLVVGVIFPMIGTSVLEYSNEQDEISGFDKIQLTFPMTRREIVLSKYISGCVAMGGTFLISFILMLVFTYGFRVTSLSAGLQIWGVGIVMGIAFFSVVYVAYFFLGKSKATVIYLMLVIGIAVGYVMVTMGFGISTVLNMNKTYLIAVGLPVDLALLWGSFRLSVKIYTWRHS